MAKSSLLLVAFSLVIFSLFSLSSPLTSETIINAVDTLSNSGYIAMSLTLQLTSQTILTSQRRSATIFSPPDSSFADSGQPSISVLQLHFVPVAFSVESLRSLPYGTKIPTMSSGHSLTVTSNPSDCQFSLNNVNISGSPVYDDGSLVVFGIDNFFDLDFSLLDQIQSPGFGCVLFKDYPKSSGAFSFHEASRMLRSRGYSVMASFLDLQFLGILGQPKLTVFAPVDEVMVEKASDFVEYSSLFLRHVIPCKLSWTGLANLHEGTELHTYLEGFNMNITRSSDIFLVNEVAITFPDMYHSDWLVVHGVHEMLSLPRTPEQNGHRFSENVMGRNQEFSIGPNHGEF